MKKNLLPILITLCFLGISCQTCPEKEELAKMKTLEQIEEQNKIIAERWHYDISIKMDWKVAEEILASDIIVHSPGMEDVKGIEGVKGLGEIWAAMKNAEIDHYEIVAEGDYVYMRWDMSFDNTVDLMGIPATGKRITGIGGMDLFLIKDGKIKEFWQYFNQVEFLKQLGALPS